MDLHFKAVARQNMPRICLQFHKATVKFFYKRKQLKLKLALCIADATVSAYKGMGIGIELSVN